MAWQDDWGNHRCPTCGGIECDIHLDQERHTTMTKEYTNLTTLAARAASASEQEEMLVLIDDISREMSRCLQLLREEDDKSIRDLITEDRFQMKGMRADVQSRLNRLVRAKILARKK